MIKFPWFRLMPIKSENFPEMGSENFLAVGRFIKMMSELLYKMNEDSPVFFSPKETQKNLNKKVNIAWLKLRNLNTSGNATEVRSNVKVYMDSDNCPKVPDNTNKVKNLELVRFYASTSNMVSHLLAYSINHSHIEKFNLFVKKILNDMETMI